MTKHARHLKTLTHVALATEKFGGAKMAAAVVHRGQALGVGVNGQKGHPLQRFSRGGKCKGRHAEVDAIAQVGYDMPTNCTLYVARVRWTCTEKVQWEVAMARPCDGCWKVAEMFGVKDVVWTTDDGGFEVCSVKCA